MSVISANGRARGRGFTIVELLVVVVIIGILAAITVVAYNGIQNRARASITESDLNSLNKKLAAYAIEYGAFPPSIDAMRTAGFGSMVDKMTDSKDVDRGEYGLAYVDNSGSQSQFWMVYWDYKEESWKYAWIEQVNGDIGELYTYDSGFVDPVSGTSPCRAEHLIQCNDPEPM